MLRRVCFGPPCARKSVVKSGGTTSKLRLPCTHVSLASPRGERAKVCSMRRAKSYRARSVRILSTLRKTVRELWVKVYGCSGNSERSPGLGYNYQQRQTLLCRKVTKQQEKAEVKCTNSGFLLWSRMSVAHQWQMFLLPASLRRSNLLFCEWVAHRRCNRNSACHLQPLFRKKSNGIAVRSLPHHSCRHAVFLRGDDKSDHQTLLVLLCTAWTKYVTTGGEPCPRNLEP